MEIPADEDLLDPADEDLLDPAVEDIPPEPVFRSNSGDFYEDDIVQLLKSENPDDADKLKSLLSEVVSVNNLRAFEFLMSNGCKIDIMNEKNQTCIHLAYFTYSWDILSSSNLWLPNLSDDMITCTDSSGLTFLHIACYIADESLARKCLTNNLDVNAKFYCSLQNHCHNGFTPLHFASTSRVSSIVYLLLTSGALVSAIDCEGRIPLHVACCVFENPDSEELQEHINKRLDIIKLLLENHSDLRTQDKHGNIPLFSIFPSNYNIFQPYFITSVPIVETKLKLNLFLEQNVDLSVKNNINESILHCIIGNLMHLRLPFDLEKLSFDDTHHVEMIKMIFDNDSNIELNGMNIYGQTPLQLAVSYMSIDIVKILLQKSADVNTVKFSVINNGHCFYYPFIIPNLQSVINIELITRLLSQNNFQMTVEQNLNILIFLVHNVLNCECSVIQTSNDIENRFGKILSFGPFQHNVGVFRNLMQTEEHEDLWIVFSGKHIHTKIVNKFYCRLFHVQYFELIKKSFPTLDFQNLSFDEMLDNSIIRMKSTILRDNVTLYDIMVKNPHYVHKYLKDTETYLLVLNLLNKYHRFLRDMIEGHVAYSLMRDYFERSAFDYLERLFPFLPEPCLKVLIHHLDEENIVKVGLAVI